MEVIKWNTISTAISNYKNFIKRDDKNNTYLIKI